MGHLSAATKEATSTQDGGKRVAQRSGRSGATGVRGTITNREQWRPRTTADAPTRGKLIKAPAVAEILVNRSRDGRASCSSKSV